MSKPETSGTGGSIAGLDQAQREAIRREVDLRLGAYGDFTILLEQRNRSRCLAHIELMRDAVALLDLIGWNESDPGTGDAADVAEYAREFADELYGALPDIDPDDGDLDALTGLRLIAGAGA